MTTTSPSDLPSPAPEAVDLPAGKAVPKAILGVVGVCVVAGLLLWARQAHAQNDRALAAQPKGVGTVPVAAATYRASSRFVGSLMPWEEAKVGPQFISAYITQVMVRPGDSVRRGQVLATLQPERAASKSQASELQVKAIEAREDALRKEADRVRGLQRKGIVSVNEAEKKLAEAASEQARLGAAKAELSGSSLELQDSSLRAPFDGEIAERTLDPGAFVHPGAPILTVVDRRKIRVSADASEADFRLLAPGTPVQLRILATGETLKAAIARRAPSADASTRTIHFEVDLPNPDRRLPTGTTAEIGVESDQKEAALAIPVAAASVKGTKATVFVAEGTKAKRVVLTVLGEREGQLFVKPDLPTGAMIVLEGRNQLQDGDAIAPRPVR
ncbi:MAG TPA: efflux RND transporter periplasmic adaptor subunit [Holophagaceae bacterium]|nr:efflux RND transporter periplasmic adaptor subunit [Holophagaceae bacterium]